MYVFDSLNIPGMLNTVQVSRALIMVIESRPNVDFIEDATTYNSANICLIIIIEETRFFIYSKDILARPLASTKKNTAFWQWVKMTTMTMVKMKRRNDKK